MALLGLAITYLTIGAALNVWVWQMVRTGQHQWAIGHEPGWADWLWAMVSWPTSFWGSADE